MGNEIVFVTHNTGKIKSAEKYFKILQITNILIGQEYRHTKNGCVRFRLITF